LVLKIFYKTKEFKKKEECKTKKGDIEQAETNGN